MGRIQNAVKALGGARLVNRKDFLLPLSDIGGGGLTSGATINRYGSKATQLKANIGAVWQANEIICIAAAGVPIKLRRKKSDGTYEEVTEHKLLDVIEKPNAFLTGKQLRKLHFTYMNMVGEAYELMYDPDQAKVPRALHVLPAHTTDFELKQTWDNSVVKSGDKTFTLFEVLRDINPDPENPYRGRGVVAAAAATLDTDSQAKEYNRRFFANSARPSVTVETAGEMSDKAYERFKQSFNDSFTGTENAHKPIIVEGATVKPFMLTQKEMDFLASQQFTRKEILAFFFVSGAMLGDTDNANRSNMDASEYNLAKYAVKPRVEQYLELLNTRLVDLVDTSLEFYTDPIVPEDIEAKLKEAEASVHTWATIDEVREKYGLDALPGGKGAVMYVPANLVPIDLAGSVPVTPAAADGGKGHAHDERGKKKLTYPVG
jgi:HK97 family phage portal protein